ncbi:hypothetical protein N656DRAFT_700414, partial [Canariomyces notabilis]
LLFSNPSWTAVESVSNTVIRNITALSAQLTHSTRFTEDATVLSSRFAEAANGVIQGLLYVPDVPDGHPCLDAMAKHIPASAPRQSDLPPAHYHMIAIAPWVNHTCAEVYLASARSDPVRAFVFYTLENPSVSPPPADSREWYIRDDARWMSETSWPVFAVAGSVGEVMIRHSSLYSGNLTEAPFGASIAGLFNSNADDYLRIWTELVVNTPLVPLAIWVYALMIIGLLLAVILSASILMHLVQALRRAQLRRRVRSGEVNLEAMGIKQLTVPMDHIQTFPLYTYHYEPECSGPSQSRRSTKPSKSRVRRKSPGETASNPPSQVPTVATGYQPRCEICLEPYENRSTIIRELACGHIFHPECIDEFLNEISSLCPLCKTSILPKGYCPKITNAMVRRERAIRRIRGRIDLQDTNGRQMHNQSWLQVLRHRISGAKSCLTSPVPSTEPKMIQLQLRPTRRGQDGNTQETRTATHARQRMRELAGPGLDDAEDDGSTLWKRLRNRVFPGFD